MRVRIFVIVVLIPLPLWSQESGQAADITTLLRLPASISGELLPGEAIVEGQRSRELAGAVEIGTECNDNALSTTRNPVSDCTYSVRPSFSFRQAGSRSSWNLTYMPGFVAHQRFDHYNETAHTVGLDAEYRFTRRLTARVRELFERSTDLSSLLEQNPDLPTFGLVQAPNPAVTLPVARQIVSTSGLETTYRLSATSFMGVTATYSDLQYEDVATSAQALPRTQTGTAGAIYSRLVKRRHWVGVNYNFQHLRWGGSSWAATQGVLYTHTMVLGKHLRFSGFIGPNYSRDHSAQTASTIPSLSAKWFLSGGGAVGWSTLHNTLEASFARRVSDGGGFIGPATLNNTTVLYSRHLGARLLISFSGSLGNTAELGTNGASAGTPSRLRTALLQGGIEYQLHEHIALRMYYGRDWQENLAGSSVDRIQRNRVGLSLAYGFGRALGK